jgi:CRP-like cAMP-binding protein
LFDGAPRSATVKAVEECRLLVIDGDCLLGFMDRHPLIGYGLLKLFIGTLVGRLRGADERLFSLFAWGLRAHGIDREL